MKLVGEKYGKNKIQPAVEIFSDDSNRPSSFRLVTAREYFFLQLNFQKW
jgi:hypothetical protein